MYKFFIFINILFLVGCKYKSTSEKEARTVFRYNQHNPITSLDPAFARSQNNIWAVDCLFNGLLQLDDSLRIQPCLAHAWEISPDGLTYRFFLRTDVYFPDDPAFPQGKGRKMKASDVVFSFGRLLDPDRPKPGSWIFKDRVADSLPFSAPNDSVFVLRLKRPFQPVLQLLTMHYASILAPEAAAYYGSDLRRHPVGTGPFQLKIWAENQAMVLLKNPDYFETDSLGNRLPYLDAVKINFITDRKTAFLEFKKGNLDYLFGLESSYSNELLTSEGNLRPELTGKIVFRKAPYLNMEYLGIRLDTLGNPALRRREVRQALNYGINRSELLKLLRNNIGRPANAGFVPLGAASFDDKTVQGYTYNPALAAALLARAGYPKGRGLPEIKLLCNADYLDLCTFIVRQWADLNIHVQLEPTETALLREKMRNGQAAFFRASWIADYPDAENFLTCFYSKNGAPPNYTAFQNAEFDRLYEAALLENDQARRYALYQKMDNLLVEEAPVVFLFYDETARFTLPNVSGLSDNSVNLLSLKRVRKMPDRR